MAISITNLTGNQSLTGATSYATASISPASNNLILAAITSRVATSSQPNQPTASGCGLTWVVVATVNYDIQGSSRKRLTLFRALGTASAGAVTFDFAGETQTEAAWSVEQVSGIDTSGTNGSAAIVQSATNLGDQTGGGSFTVTLGAFSDANNATYGVFACDVASAATVGSGFTQLSETHTTFSFISEWKTANDTTVDATLPTGTNANSGGIAIEIKQLKAWSQSLTDTVTIAESQGKAIKPKQLDTMALAETTGKAEKPAKTDTVTITETLVKAPKQSLTDTIGITDSLVRRIVLSKLETIGITDSINTGGSVSWSKALSDTFTIADSVVKAYGLSQTDTEALADSIVRAVKKVLTETVAITDSTTLPAAPAATVEQRIYEATEDIFKMYPRVISSTAGKFKKRERDIDPTSDLFKGKLY